MSKKVDLTGKRFCNLMVLNFSESKFINGKKRRFYNCSCSCGNICEIRSEFLTRGLQKSCGCLRKRTGSENPKWTGYGEISGELWSCIQLNAIGKGSGYKRKTPIAFSISIRYAWNLFLKQNRICSLSGVSLSFRPERTASLDRIDSKKGYVRGNVQWIHKDLNIMKQSFSQDHFVLWCKKVASCQEGVAECLQNT